MNANKLLNLTVPCENEFHRALFSEKNLLQKNATH